MGDSKRCRLRTLRYVDAKLRMSEADHKLYLREFKEQVRGGRRWDFGR